MAEKDNQRVTNVKLQQGINTLSKDIGRLSDKMDVVVENQQEQVTLQALNEQAIINVNKQSEENKDDIKMLNRRYGIWSAITTVLGSFATYIGLK